jgi:ribosomal-protein-alanine N-acetyltransferase
MISEDLETGRILLTPLTESHVSDTYRQWLIDPEINKNLETRFDVPTLHGLRNYVTSMRSSSDSYLFGIISKKTGAHCGNIKLGPINRHHLSASVGLIIGDQNSWGKGIATEAIDLLTGWSFSTLGLRKLTAGSYQGNVGSIRAFEKCGYQIEGTQRSQVVMADGTRGDVVLLGMTNMD